MHNISALTTTCDKKIIKIYIPGTDLTPGGIRATGIQLRLAGPNCCSISNIIDIPVPPPPPPPPQPTPDQCLPTLDLYGYSAIVSYDPVNCRAGHACDAAIFDLYIDNYFIGQANLNNANNGGYREGVFIINEHIITSINTTVELRCALARCHQGIGRIVIKDPDNNIIFSSCLPNDSIVGIGNNICPTPTVTTTPTPTPTPIPINDPISLLMHFDGNSFIDSSLYNHTITSNGSVSINNSVGLFEGGYLDIPSSSAFGFGTGNFTIEMFVRPMGQQPTLVGGLILIGEYWDGILWRHGVNPDNLYISSFFEFIDWNPEINAPMNQWTHIALVRNGSNVTVYASGVSVATTTTAVDLGTEKSVTIGSRQGGNEPYIGAIDEIKITKGQALYTNNFSPPDSSSLPNWGVIQCPPGWTASNGGCIKEG